jgi:hypothetical protein
VRDADWLDPTDTDADDPGARRARPLLLALASIPWLIVIGLLVVPGRLPAGDPPSPYPDDAATPDTPPGPSPDGPAVDEPSLEASPDMQQPNESDDPAGETVLDGQERRGGWRVAAGPEEAVGLAVVAGRAWLTGVEPVLDLALEPDPRGEERGRWYAEHLVVEAVEQPAPDALVVTIVAVVLDTAGSFEPTVKRLAVPVALTPQGPRLAGAPWELPPPVLEAVALPREATDDAVELTQARRALSAAGLGDLDLVALHHTDGWPVIAEVATTDEDAVSEVWLRPHLDGYVVAGTTLAGLDVQEPIGATS